MSTEPGQMYIPLNPNAYSPNTLNNGYPKQANQTDGNGFFTAPKRTASGALERSLSQTFADVWSQPRLFFNSLHPAERQFLVNAMRFETSHVTSEVVRENVIIQLNRVSNNLARRVASAIGVKAPEPDETYYHTNKTSVSLGAFGTPLKKLDGLKIGILSSVKNLEDAQQLRTALLQKESVVDVFIVVETLVPGQEKIMTYTGADAIAFDAVVAVTTNPEFFSGGYTSPLFPAGRPLQIFIDAYRYGKPVGVVGSGVDNVLENAGIGEENRGDEKGVFMSQQVDGDLATAVLDGLKVFKYLDRFKLDEDSEE